MNWMKEINKMNKKYYTGVKTVYAKDMLPSKNVYHDGDTIDIDGHKYVIAGVKTGGYTLLDASGKGWMPAGGLD